MTYLDTLEPIIADTIAPAALATDQQALYPRPALDALAQASLLGLLSAKAASGLQGTIADAAQTVQRIAQDCPSTAMVPTSDLLLDQIGSAPCEAETGQQAQS